MTIICESRQRGRSVLTGFNWATLSGQTPRWLRDKHAHLSILTKFAGTPFAICSRRSASRRSRGRVNDQRERERILSRALVASAQPRGCRRGPSEAAQRRGVRWQLALCTPLSSTRLMLGKTGARRVANVRPELQLKSDSEEGTKRLLLCSVSFLILKKGA